MLTVLGSRFKLPGKPLPRTSKKEYQWTIRIGRYSRDVPTAVSRNLVCVAVYHLHIIPWISRGPQEGTGADHHGGQRSAPRKNGLGGQRGVLETGTNVAQERDDCRKSLGDVESSMIESQSPTKNL